ncbi:MAG: hypothetical protein JWN25_1496 [Verrucomicrobiales bacterium]|nr:hypothetical protein [Verrucomicrobiales bacterium]
MNCFINKLELVCLSAVSGILVAANGHAAEVSSFGVGSMESVDSTSTFPRFTHAGLHYKMLDVHAGLAVTATYDENLNLVRSNKLSDFVFSLNPLLSIRMADPAEAEPSKSLGLTYTPSIERYLSQSSLDRMNQGVNFAALLPMPRLRLGITQSFTDNSSPVVDVQRRVNTQTYGTMLSSSYILSEKTSFEVNGNYNLSQNEGLVSTEEYLNQNWLNYVVTPKVSASLGLGLGLNKTDQGDDQRLMNLLLRSSYRLAEKVNVSISAGAEVRDYKTGGMAVDPVFSASARYRLSENSGISFTASRETHASVALVRQNYTSTGFNLDLYQKLFDRLSGTIGFGYDNLDYQSTAASLAKTRSDSLISANLAATWSFTDSLRSTFAYTFRNNTSTDDRLNVHESVISISTSYLY